MTDFNFKIVGKDGKVIEDLSFEDFDEIADYMLDAADKWYDGLQDPGTTMSFERREDGHVVFSDKSSFGGEDVTDVYDDGSEVERDMETLRKFLGASELSGSEDGEDS